MEDVFNRLAKIMWVDHKLVEANPRVVGVFDVELLRTPRKYLATAETADWLEWRPGIGMTIAT